MSRGGKRAGSGRPKKEPILKKKTFTTRIPVWLIDWMDDQSTAKSLLIEQALIAHYNIKKPDVE